jgi:hypothetical protein
METMNTRRALFAALILLTTILACAVPGLPAASQPAPTADTRLEIMVAETVSAALEQTQQAVPTPTIAPTSTSSPRPTITPSPTPDADDSGSALNKQDDGSVHFTDTKAGYEVTVSTGWLPVRINSQEYLEAWLLPELTNPSMQRSLSSIENLNPDEIRLFILDTQEGHAEIDFVTNISIYWDQKNETSLENDEDLKAQAEALLGALAGLEVTLTEISTTANGVPIGVITSKTPITTLDGVSVEMFQKQVFIDINVGTLIVTLTTTEELRQTVLPQFDAMIETLKIEE